MYIFATFEHSTFLELAITEMIKEGVSKEKILAVPLDKLIEKQKILDTIHQSDGVSLIDGAAVMGTIFMVLGTIYGFIWEWGPILWGLIGLAFGAALGLVLDFLIDKRRGKRKGLAGKVTEVILVVHCTENQVEMVENILWEYLAIGVARVAR